MFIEILGSVGVFLLATCAIPQVIDTLRNGYSAMNALMLWLWKTGSWMMLCYALVKFGFSLLCVSYMAAILFSSVILFYKYFPRKK